MSICAVLICWLCVRVRALAFICCHAWVCVCVCVTYWWPAWGGVVLLFVGLFACPNLPAAFHVCQLSPCLSLCTRKHTLVRRPPSLSCEGSVHSSGNLVPVKSERQRARGGKEGGGGAFVWHQHLGVRWTHRHAWAHARMHACAQNYTYAATKFWIFPAFASAW